jgi:hypothetical protein
MNLLLLSFLVGEAHAVDTSFGFAVDAVAGGGSTGNGPQAYAGLREVEGDLGIVANAFRARANLEVGVAKSGDAMTLTLLRAEHLTVGLDTGSLVADVGVSVSPWRIESNDPWQNALVTNFTGTRAVPAQILGGSVSKGTRSVYAQAIAGYAYGGNGVDFANGTPEGGTRIVGVFGAAGLGAKANSTRISGGVWTHPGTGGDGGFQLGARVDVALLAVQTELVGTFDGILRGQLEAEALSRLPFTPVARLSWDEGPGVAMGARIKPFPLVALKAQGAWEREQFSGWVEAVVYTIPDPLHRRERDDAPRKRGKDGGARVPGGA